MSLTKIASNTDDDFQTAAPGRKREFLYFLKSIRSFKGDLSAFTAPSFLLSATSLIEHCSFWTEEPALFIAPSLEPSPAVRSLLVLKWYLAALMQQFGHRKDGGDKRKKKKPLNPFLGEIFLGAFEHPEAGRSELVAEQVSHHPPVTAFRITNEKHGVCMEGYNAQRTYFSGTVRLERIGHVLVRYEGWGEEHLVTLPKVHLEGLLPPPPHPEMDGGTKIVSSAGFVTELEYSGKGWLRGKRNSFTARIYREDESAETVYTAEGQWNLGSFVVKDAKGEVIETVDTTGPRAVTPIIVKSVDEQDPLESRRAWFKVSQAIEKGDMATVTREKSKIEEEQRAMRKTELIEEREWQMRYFQDAESWPEVERLAGKIGAGVERERTKGIWRWAGEAADLGKTQEMNGAIHNMD